MKSTNSYQATAHMVSPGSDSHPLLPPLGYMIAVGTNGRYFPQRLWRGEHGGLQPQLMLQPAVDGRGHAGVWAVWAVSYNEALFICQREADTEERRGRGWLSDWAWTPSYCDRVDECIAQLKDMTGCPPLLWEFDCGIAASCVPFRSSTGRWCAGGAVWGVSIDEALQTLCEVAWAAFDDGEANLEQGHFDIGGEAVTVEQRVGHLAIAS